MAEEITNEFIANATIGELTQELDRLLEDVDFITYQIDRAHADPKMFDKDWMARAVFARSMKRHAIRKITREKKAKQKRENAIKSQNKNEILIRLLKQRVSEDEFLELAQKANDERAQNIDSRLSALDAHD